MSAEIKKIIFPIIKDMRNEMELESIIEDYLNGKLSEAEAQAFEQLRKNDQTVDHKVVAHKVFLDSLKDYASITALKDQMNRVHETIDVHQLSTKLGPHPSFIINIWREYKAVIAVAASFIILTSVSIYSIQQNTRQNATVQLVSRDLAKMRNSTNALIRDIKMNNKVGQVVVNPADIGGTGFALTSNGYICTNFHVIDGADSVYVQNFRGDTFKAKVELTDTLHDLTILKITDKSFLPLSVLPYNLKKNTIAIGEDVYTLGFPKDDAVLGNGYISSKTGYDGDTSSYQVNIQVNGGNSGGPLIDTKGNVIGVISGKEKQVDGATFAIKAKYLQTALNGISDDSLSRKVSFNNKSSLQGLSRSKQIKLIEPYVFMIKVYKQ
jgi:serine protease Do